jgi:HK97 family phage major capsid protein
MASKARPYSFSALINSLSSQTSRDDTSGWERGLGERCGRMYGQTLNRSEREQACFVPSATMVCDLLTSPASAGGDLIATSVLAVSESVRPPTVLEAAGVQRLEVSGDNLSLPRFVEAAAAFIAEGANYPPLSTTTTSVDATPRLASARIAFSRRLKVLVPDAETAVLAEVGRAVAALIERGCIDGTGTNAEPLGLLNLPGKLTQSFAASPPTSAELALMLEKLGDAKADLSRVVFLLHPSTAAGLMPPEVSATSGQLVLRYYEGAYRIHGRPVFISTNVTEDKVLALDPTFSRIIYFGASQIVVDPYSGALNGETRLNVLNGVDFICTHQPSVCVGSA